MILIDLRTGELSTKVDKTKKQYLLPETVGIELDELETVGLIPFQYEETSRVFWNVQRKTRDGKGWYPEIPYNLIISSTEIITKLTLLKLQAS